MDKAHAALANWVAGQVERAGTMNKLSVATGVSFKCLRGIEAGKHSPTLSTLVRLAEGCGITIGELVQIIR